MTVKKDEQFKSRTGDIANGDHENAAAALLIIDMIADFEFEDGDQIFEQARSVAHNIGALKTKLCAAGFPVIYVNDNYGQWKSDFAGTLAAAKNSAKGRQIVSCLEPDKDEYHILKPQRSGFFATPLDVLLKLLRVSNLIVTGITTDICVLFTAHDAYMRGYKLYVPADCCAAITPDESTAALRLIERIADADIAPSTEIDLFQDFYTHSA